MPIAGAAISAVASVGGAVLGAKAQKKAAKTAAAAQTQTAEQNNALQRDIYGQNKATLAPFVGSGQAAGNQINALLGLQVPQQQQQPINAMQNAGFNRNYSINDYAYNGAGADPNMPWAQTYVPQGTVNTQQMQIADQQPTTQQNALAAYDQFKNFGGYQTRLNEGNRSINTGYAAKGQLESGAALKALARFNQDYASNEFGKYMGYLGNQQGVGLTAASAQAGVGQNYANSVSANNQNAADAISNSAIARGNATGGLYSGIANGIGNIAGQFASSYKPQTNALMPPASGYVPSGVITPNYGF